MQPRRKQEPISIRPDRAAARLEQLTRDGRSQADAPILCTGGDFASTDAAVHPASRTA